MSKRPIRVEGNLAYIPLTQGFEAVIDALDIALAQGKNWHASRNRKTVYAKIIVCVNGKRTSQYLHRAIIGPEDLQVDHIDGNGLNNTRANLRTATSQQNRCNQRIRSNNKSGFKGVSWEKEYEKWKAQIKIHGKSKSLGLFVDIEDAIEAYAAASAQMHGEFGWSCRANNIGAKP
jgi:hypothetical protein